MTDAMVMTMTKLLITGVAGFIGSHLLHEALDRGYSVVGVDNFLTGKMSNIEAVLRDGGADRFELRRQDIRDLPDMIAAAEGCDTIFHEAAIGSVPWSIDDPLLAHSTNLTGFLNILEAARKNHVRRVVYASSSAVFGDSTHIPAVEGIEGNCLSPYASSKRSQEIYAQSYARCYDMQIVGLRYFNVFGARQDPNGAYAAVIPKWGLRMAQGKPCILYGDGTSTRDYCHVSNIVNANFLAAEADLQKSGADGIAPALNIGCGAQTSLISLFEMMREAFRKHRHLDIPEPVFEPPRAGDIEHSSADIQKATRVIGFLPKVSVQKGLDDLIMFGEFDRI